MREILLMSGTCLFPSSKPSLNGFIPSLSDEIHIVINQNREKMFLNFLLFNMHLNNSYTVLVNFSLVLDVSYVTYDIDAIPTKFWLTFHCVQFTTEATL